MIKVFASVFLACSVVLPANAADYCDINTVVAGYNSALKRKKMGDEEGAKKLFTSLGNIGVAPAQRHLAEYYRDESRDDDALEKALMWAQLGAWGSDGKASQMVGQINESVRHIVSERGLAWAKEWLPAQSNCYGGFIVDEDDDDMITVDQYPVLRGENVEREIFIAFATRLKEALRSVDKVAPQLASLVQLTPAFEVIEGQGTDRYLAWSEDGTSLQISAGFLEDRNVRQLAYTLILAVQRQLYDKIKDAQFNDPLARNFGEIKLFGSIYGDVRTNQFLDDFEKALKLAYRLPTILFDQVSQIDQIYYMPPSKYHYQRWSSFEGFSLYDHKRSAKGERIAYVMQKMGFETPEELALHLVRLGVQAKQHNLIESYRSQVYGKSREESILAALEGDGSIVENAFNNSLSKKKQMVEQWDQKGPDGISSLYCEAALMQVKAAIALKMPRSKVTQSVKLKNCKKAKTAWQKYDEKEN